MFEFLTLSQLNQTQSEIFTKKKKQVAFFPFQYKSGT